MLYNYKNIKNHIIIINIKSIFINYTIKVLKNYTEKFCFKIL